MVSMNTNELLNVMRQMAIEAQGSQKNINITSAENDNQFATYFNNAINSVSNAEIKANELAERFEKNDSSVSLSDVMISMQKSHLQFQALTQVRNRFVAAYQDIMNMPL